MSSRPFRLACWLSISLLSVGLDYLLGPNIQFPFLYLVPVALSAWFDGLWISLALALVLPAARFYLMSQWDFPLGIDTAVINAAIRVVVLSCLALAVDRIARQTRLLAREVRALEGLLPICAHCKKIRDEEERWQPIERYITQRSEAEFTHSICPECAERHFGFVARKDPV
jgi:hypothetical protein